MNRLLSQSSMNMNYFHQYKIIFSQYYFYYKILEALSLKHSNPPGLVPLNFTTFLIATNLGSFITSIFAFNKTWDKENTRVYENNVIYSLISKHHINTFM